MKRLSARSRINLIDALRPPRLFALARRIYREHLRAYWVFRVLKQGLVVLIIRVHSIYLALRPMRKIVLKLKPIHDYLASNPCPTRVLEEESVLTIDGPKFVGEYPLMLNAPASVSLLQPALKVISLGECVVMGGTNFVMPQGAIVLYPDVVKLVRDVFPIETCKRARVDVEDNTIVLRVTGKEMELPRAASLLGQCTGNYAHWLTETLPKVLVLQSYGEYDGLPLLVDGWIHPVFFETLSLLLDGSRKIIQVERWERVRVSELVEISPTAYVPSELRKYVETGKLPPTGPGLYPFSRTALQKLRQALLEQVKKNAAPPGSDLQRYLASKRLYLRRHRDNSGNLREVKNIEVIEQMLEGHGFEFINPAEFSFAEQVLLFSNAEIVVSEVGAALANMIFSKPGRKIIALAAYYKNANYFYFSNLMGVLGHELYYVLGPQIDVHGRHPLHQDYTVDAVFFKTALQRLCA